MSESDISRAMEAVRATIAQAALVTAEQLKVFEGTVVEYDRTRLPQAMVECTTEYDYAELPAPMRATLEEWCEQFNEWARRNR